MHTQHNTSGWLFKTDDMSLQKLKQQKVKRSNIQPTHKDTMVIFSTTNNIYISFISMLNIDYFIPKWSIMNNMNKKTVLQSSLLLSYNNIAFTWMAARVMIMCGNKAVSWSGLSWLKIGNSSDDSSMQSRHTLSTFITGDIIIQWREWLIGYEIKYSDLKSILWGYCTQHFR